VYFLFAKKLSADFFIYKVQISTNYEKIIHEFAVISIALDRPGTIFSVVREITRMKKVNKSVIYNLIGDVPKVY
jgi:hypothetical protein